MESKLDNGRSTARRLSLKSLRKNSSYSALNEDQGSGVCSVIEARPTESFDENADMLRNCDGLSEEVNTRINEDVKHVTEDEEKYAKKKHKRKFRLLKRNREHMSTECLVIDNNDINKLENRQSFKKKLKRKFRLKKKREREFLVIEENEDINNENINDKTDRKKSKKHAKNKYEKECSLTKDEKRKKKKTKRIKKAGRNTAKAIGNIIMSDMKLATQVIYRLSRSKT